MSLLLDTCALIWLGQGEPMDDAALRAVEKARTDGGVLISAVSVWEVGLAANRAQRPVSFLPDVATWLGRVIAAPGLLPLPLDADTALASTMLPAWAHRDPGDRFLVAIARARDIPIVTSDVKILAYADAGHVRAIAC